MNNTNTFNKFVSGALIFILVALFFMIYLYNLATETEVRITENNYDQIKPVITDNYIVWSDNRNKDFDIYLYNVLTREEIQITDTRLQNEFNPKVSNKGIIWHTGTGDNLYFYNFQTKETTNLGIGFPSYISDNFIVWVKDNHLNIKDLSSNINQLIVIGKDSGSSGLGNLRLFNDKIIYTNTVNGKYSLYLRDLRNYDEKIIPSVERIEGKAQKLNLIFKKVKGAIK